MIAPRVLSVPDYASSAGQEAVELAAMAGLVLDPWEAFVLDHALGERKDGTWAAFEVGVMVSRQNGKGAILEARELAGLFLLGERLIIHSAHMFDTSLEAFRRLLLLIEETPDLDRRVARVSRSHGEEGIELRGGQRIRFRTRSKSGGRGFTGDCLILDEAMDLPESFHGALLPTLSARSIVGDPQVWYAGSAVDQTVHEHGVVFARVRERGHRGGDPSLAWFEWSIDERDQHGRPAPPDRVRSKAAASEDSWAQANPGLGIRISAEHIERERMSMDPRTFAVERLGVGDWPSTTGVATVIDFGQWVKLADIRSTPVDPVCFAFDVSPDRSTAAIAVAGDREDGLAHLEVVEHHRGTGWLVERLAELCEEHQPASVLCDAAGAAASLLFDLEEADIEVTALTAREHAGACGTLFDMVEQERLRHHGQEELAAAIKGAAKRPLGDAWAWSRKNSTVDISPLVAVTLALWGVATTSSGAEAAYTPVF